MRAVLAILALLAAAAPAGAQTHVVRSGPLRAEVDAAPFALRFVQETCQPPRLQRGVQESCRAPFLHEAPGVRTAFGWTRIGALAQVRREGEALVSEGNGITLRVAPGQEGEIAITFGAPDADGVALGLGFDLTEGERLLGLGQRATGVDHRGRVIESFVSDGPYRPEERPFLQAFVPPPGFRHRDDATYYPVPWVLSTRGFGVLADTDATVYHRLDGQQGWTLEATSVPDGMGAQVAPDSLTVRVFAGPRPADALRRFTRATGRQPKVDAPWVWGPWHQPGGSIEPIRRLREADAPVSVAQTYTHYLPCGDHLRRRDAERALVRDLKALGVAVTTYFNPMLCADYQPIFDEAAAAGALTRTAGGEPYQYRYASSPTNQFLVGQFDFSAPAGRAFYGRLLDEAIADGHDGWMEDFGEYTPLDSRSADGRPGAYTHNAYPVQYHCAAWEHVRRASRPIIRFQRSGWTGAARCAQVVWGGDPTTGWDFDGLESSVWSALGMGLSGVGRWGSDIGGFFALGTQRLTPELLARWLQFGAVSGVMRLQRNGVAVPSKQRPQAEDEDMLPLYRRYAKLRTQLYPYLVAADDQYRRTGMPIMRHLSLTHPQDAEAVRRDDEFLFGRDLLAAPVLRPGVTERFVHLPAGDDWVDLWRSGGLDASEVRLLAGGQEVRLPAPLEEIPLLVRVGAVIPLLPEDVDTLAPDPPPGVVGLPRDRMRLLAFPRGRTRSTMNAGETLLSRERRRGWRLRIRGARTRRYDVRAAMSTLRRPFRPCAVTVRGRRVRFGYEDGVLRVSARLRRGTISARRRC